MPENVIVVKPVYKQITGSMNSAALLAQIIYWHTPGATGATKLRVKRDGELWLVKSWKDWETEIGLSRMQSRVALDKLRALGLIFTQVHKFNSTPTTYIKLRVDMLDAAIEKVNDSAEKLPVTNHGMVTKGQSDWLPVTNLITETTKQETTHDTLSAKSENVKEAVEKENMATLEETLKFKKEQAEKVLAGTNPAKLALRWKKRLAKTYGGYVKDLTGAEMGQLGLLAKMMGPTDTAKYIEKTVDLAATNWEEYVFEVRAKYGLTTTPERPVVGFLLKYHDVAIQMLQSSAKQVKPQNVTPLKAESVAAPQEVTKTKVDVASKQMVAEALAKLKQQK
jgi:hypothetical protein